MKTTREDFQILGGVFTSNSDASRKTYVGKDQIDTNGLVLGLGKNQQNSVGKIYTFAQIGAGFYDFNSSRSVLVNGFGQTSQGLGTGDFQYLNFGAAYKIPTNLTGEFALNSSLGAQKTNRGNWSEMVTLRKPQEIWDLGTVFNPDPSLEKIPFIKFPVTDIQKLN